MHSISQLRLQPNLTISDKLRLLWKCFLLSLLVKFFGGSIIALAKVFEFNGVASVIANSSNLMDEYSVTKSVLLVVFFFPIMEELAFRGWFSKSPLLIILSLSLFLYYFIRLSFYELVLHFTPIDRAYRITLFAIIMTIGILLLSFNITKVKTLIDKRYLLFFYLSIVSFSLIHVFNYEIDEYNSKSIFSLFLLIIPYPFGAYILNYIRIKNGLFWSLALHMINNSIVLISIFFGGRI